MEEARKATHNGAQDSTVGATTVEPSIMPVPNIVLNQFHSFNTLVRVTAWVFRIAKTWLEQTRANRDRTQNGKQKGKQNIDALKPEFKLLFPSELASAKDNWIRFAQQEGLAA